MITVAKRMPKARLTAIGFMNDAVPEVSIIIGTRPKKVVMDVSRMARNRFAPASTAACARGRPSLTALFTKSTMIRESFTTTPARAIHPSMETIDAARPSARCPMIAPITPKGMTDMITNGWLYEPSGTAMSA